MRLHLGNAGHRLTIFDSQAGYIWPEKVLTLCSYMDLEQGYDLALPYEAPAVIDGLAARFGKKVYRYFSCPADGGDEEARKLASSQPWLRDGLMMAVHILNWLKQHRTALMDVVQQLPHFAVATRTIPCDGNPGKVLRQLKAEEKEAYTRSEGERTSIRPSKRGKSLHLVAEAADMEAAEEICGQLEERVRAVLLDIDVEKQ